MYVSRGGTACVAPRAPARVRRLGKQQQRVVHLGGGARNNTNRFIGEGYEGSLKVV